MPEDPLRKALHVARNVEFVARRAHRNGPTAAALQSDKPREAALGLPSSRSPRGRSASPPPIKTGFKSLQQSENEVTMTTGSYTDYVMRRHGINDDGSSSPLGAALLDRKARVQQPPDEASMQPQAYAQHALRKQGLSIDNYASSPLGASLTDAKRNRRQDDAGMDAQDYTNYVMRRHGLNDDAAASSPLSSALLKRKAQFQSSPDLGDPAIDMPGTPPGVEAYTQYVMQSHGLSGDAAVSSPLSSALLKRKAQNQAPPGTPPGVDAYTQYVMKRHGLVDDAAPTSPLSSALLKRKAQFQAQPVEQVNPEEVEALIKLFRMFDTYDIDGNGFIDKDEYWALTSKLPLPAGCNWTRAMSDADVDEMDTDGDGVVSPEEFYRHCRRCVASNFATFDAAMMAHQDVFFIPGELDLIDNPTDFLEADDPMAEPGSPLASAILAKKRAAKRDGPKLAEEVVRQKAVAALVDAFQLFEEYDEDMSGGIDPDEYYRISCKLFPNQARTREQSDLEWAAIDTNGDGLIDAEEWYRHCRYCLASDDETYRMALEQHQDVTMDLTKSNSFSEADGQVDELIKSVRLDHLLDPAEEATEMPSSEAVGALQLGDFSEKDLNLYFQRLFSIADADGNGVLDPDEVAELLSMSGFNFGAETVAQIVAMADTNSDGVIDYDEFVPLMLGVLGVDGQKGNQADTAPSGGSIDMSRYSKEHLTVYFNQLFKLGDTNGDGVLQPEEIEALLNMCGFDFSPSLVAQVVKMADTNRDGVINYAEFVPMMIGIMEGSL